MQNWGPETKQKGETDSANTKNGTENAVTTFTDIFQGRFFETGAC